MDAKPIQQEINILGDGTRTGDITQIGQLVQYVIHHPPEWQEALWSFLKNNRDFLLCALVLEGILAAFYFHYRDFHLIPWQLWVASALLLLAAARSWYSWRRLGHPSARLLPASVTSAALAGILLWQGWHMAFPKQFHPQTFGIAVAELGAGHNFHRTPAAREISGQIYQHLCQTIGEVLVNDGSGGACEAEVIGSTPPVIGIQHIGVIREAEQAEAYGRRIGADVVIWGQLLTTGSEDTTIYFLLLDTQDRAINPETPLILPVTAQTAEIFADTSELDLDSDPATLKAAIGEQSTAISSFILGVAALFDLDYAGAIQQFETVERALKHPSLSVSPEGLSLLYFYLGLANQSLSSSRLHQGQDWLTRADRLNPEEPAIPLALALSDGTLGLYEAREQHLDLALERIDTWLLFHPNDVVALYNRGIVAQIREQYVSARDDFNAVLGQNPDYYIAYISLGQVLSELGQFEDAVVQLETAIALADGSGTNPSWAYLNLGRVREKAGQPDEAREAYVTAINLDPTVDLLYLDYAEFSENQQEMDVALMAYEQMINVTQHEGWAHGKLAGFFFRRQLWEQARRHYQQALDDSPDDALLHTYLAEVYVELGEDDDAVREYEIAIELGPQIYYTHASYASSLTRMGRLVEAAGHYEQSLELRPLDHAVLLNLAQIYESLGEKDKARQLYLRIIESDEQFPASAIDIAHQRIAALGMGSP
jgi:tetratricopeptide (TPR) repeat protein